MPLLVGLSLAAVLATGSWKMYLAAAGGVLVGSAIVLRPELGIVLVAATVPLDAAGRIADVLPNVNVSIAKIFVALTLVAWLVHLGARRTRFVWTREMRWLCAYFAACLASLADTRELDLGYQAALRLLASILYYVLVVNLVRTRRQLLTALAAFTLVSVLTFAFAVAEPYLPGFTFRSRSSWGEQGAQTFGVEAHELDAGAQGTVARSTGVTYHAIVMAVDTDIVLPLLVAATLFAASPLRRSLLWAAVAVSLAANLSAYSRTGLVFLLVTAGLLVQRRILRVTPVRVAVIVAAIVVALPFASESLFERVLSPKAYTTEGSESLRERVRLMKAGWAAFADHPVNGMGMETTFRIFDYFDYPDKTAVITVHNGYLQVALEVGLVGLAALLVFFARSLSSFRAAARAFRKRGDRAMATLAESLLVGFVIFLLAGFVLDFMRIGFKNVWFLIALAPVLRRMSREESEATAGGSHADVTDSAAGPRQAPPFPPGVRL